MFTPENVNLARKFMAGPRGSSSQYPNMAGFSQTPQGQSALQRVLQTVRKRPQSRQPASSTGRRPTS